MNIRLFGLFLVVTAVVCGGCSSIDRDADLYEPPNGDAAVFDLDALEE